MRMQILCDVRGSKAISLPFTVSNVNSTPDLSYILFFLSATMFRYNHKKSRACYLLNINLTSLVL